ncbi:hypothetical protein SARC_09574 [Sphaeroforma arctica JP610]|uniref:Uncharacterized protein n=1 Tax=Sphaeroforma arctica JP610 TaxID=667725 RepID=A0A0L0FMJ1_9EUKA|nr:hypothetical protein SARC_09574 [Sphaeroforma arctica JP610]KNC77977.1 hypothetical protein SARC_09574 [Sphaeroforma arctica JP610]|eukprot:XP_014151879.1 hypothetical protein SARC_09574 [Sphaeroforma arctica JP610]
MYASSFTQQAKVVTYHELAKLVGQLESQPEQYIKAQRKRIREENANSFFARGSPPALDNATDLSLRAALSPIFESLDKARKDSRHTAEDEASPAAVEELIAKSTHTSANPGSTNYTLVSANQRPVYRGSTQSSDKPVPTGITRNSAKHMPVPPRTANKDKAPSDSTGVRKNYSGVSAKRVPVNRAYTHTGNVPIPTDSTHVSSISRPPARNAPPISMYPTVSPVDKRDAGMRSTPTLFPSISNPGSDDTRPNAHAHAHAHAHADSAPTNSYAQRKQSHTRSQQPEGYTNSTTNAPTMGVYGGLLEDKYANAYHAVSIKDHATTQAHSGGLSKADDSLMLRRYAQYRKQRQAQGDTGVGAMELGTDIGGLGTGEIGLGSDTNAPGTGRKGLSGKAGTVQTMAQDRAPGVGLYGNSAVTGQRALQTHPTAQMTGITTGGHGRETAGLAREPVAVMGGVGVREMETDKDEENDGENDSELDELEMTKEEKQLTDEAEALLASAERLLSGSRGAQGTGTRPRTAVSVGVHRDDRVDGAREKTGLCTARETAQTSSTAPLERSVGVNGRAPVSAPERAGTNPIISHDKLAGAPGPVRGCGNENGVTRAATCDGVGALNSNPVSVQQGNCDSLPGSAPVSVGEGSCRKQPAHEEAVRVHNPAVETISSSTGIGAKEAKWTNQGHQKAISSPRSSLTVDDASLIKHAKRTGTCTDSGSDRRSVYTHPEKESGSQSACSNPGRSSGYHSERDGVDEAVEEARVQQIVDQAVNMLSLAEHSLLSAKNRRSSETKNRTGAETGPVPAKRPSFDVSILVTPAEEMESEGINRTSQQMSAQNIGQCVDRDDGDTPRNKQNASVLDVRAGVGMDGVDVHNRRQEMGARKVGEGLVRDGASVCGGEYRAGTLGGVGVYTSWTRQDRLTNTQRFHSTTTTHQSYRHSGSTERQSGSSTSKVRQSDNTVSYIRVTAGRESASGITSHGDGAEKPAQKGLTQPGAETGSAEKQIGTGGMGGHTLSRAVGPTNQRLPETATSTQEVVRATTTQPVHTTNKTYTTGQGLHCRASEVQAKATVHVGVDMVAAEGPMEVDVRACDQDRPSQTSIPPAAGSGSEIRAAPDMANTSLTDLEESFNRMLDSYRSPIIETGQPKQARDEARCLDKDEPKNIVGRPGPVTQKPESGGSQSVSRSDRPTPMSIGQTPKDAQPGPHSAAPDTHVHTHAHTNGTHGYSSVSPVGGNLAVRPGQHSTMDAQSESRIKKSTPHHRVGVLMYSNGGTELVRAHAADTHTSTLRSERVSVQGAVPTRAPQVHGLGARGHLPDTQILYREQKGLQQVRRDDLDLPTQSTDEKWNGVGDKAGAGGAKKVPEAAARARALEGADLSAQTQGSRTDTATVHVQVTADEPEKYDDSVNMRVFKAPPSLAMDTRTRATGNTHPYIGGATTSTQYPWLRPSANHNAGVVSLPVQIAALASEECIALPNQHARSTASTNRIAGYESLARLITGKITAHGNDPLRCTGAESSSIVTMTTVVDKKKETQKQKIWAVDALNATSARTDSSMASENQRTVCVGNGPEQAEHRERDMADEIGTETSASVTGGNGGTVHVGGGAERESSRSLGTPTATGTPNEHRICGTGQREDSTVYLNYGTDQKKDRTTPRRKQVRSSGKATRKSRRLSGIAPMSEAEVIRRYDTTPQKSDRYAPTPKKSDTRSDKASGMSTRSGLKKGLRSSKKKGTPKTAGTSIQRSKSAKRGTNTSDSTPRITRSAAKAMLSMYGGTGDGDTYVNDSQDDLNCTVMQYPSVSARKKASVTELKKGLYSDANVPGNVQDKPLIRQRGGVNEEFGHPPHLEGQNVGQSDSGRMGAAPKVDYGNRGGPITRTKFISPGVVADKMHIENSTNVGGELRGSGDTLRNICGEDVHASDNEYVRVSTAPVLGRRELNVRVSPRNDVALQKKVSAENLMALIGRKLTGERAEMSQQGVPMPGKAKAGISKQGMVGDGPSPRGAYFDQEGHFDAHSTSAKGANDSVGHTGMYKDVPTRRYNANGSEKENM